VSPVCLLYPPPHFPPPPLDPSPLLLLRVALCGMYLPVVYLFVVDSLLVLFFVLFSVGSLALCSFFLFFLLTSAVGSSRFLLLSVGVHFFLPCCVPCCSLRAYFMSVYVCIATAGNTYMLADWIGRIKKKKVYVMGTTKRPTPLEHYLYCNEEMYKIVDRKSQFLHVGYVYLSPSAHTYWIAKKANKKKKKKTDKKKTNKK